MTTTDEILAWHFVKGTTLRDGTPLECRVYTHDGPLVMCEQGLHASVRAFDALSYAPGATVCRVRVGGLIEHGDDKLVAQRREVLWYADANAELRAFARWCALQVIDLWDVPAVVREYLETGDEAARAAAWNAAWDAAWAAARDAARDAALAAARAAWAAARDAAGDAAVAAARAAAWNAARAAARATQNAELERRLLALEEGQP